LPGFVSVDGGFVSAVVTWVRSGFGVDLGRDSTGGVVPFVVVVTVVVDGAAAAAS
jgi:hypothetical protein